MRLIIWNGLLASICWLCRYINHPTIAYSLYPIKTFESDSFSFRNSWFGVHLRCILCNSWWRKFIDLGVIKACIIYDVGHQ
jgi:hypothetical protein